MAKPIKQTPSVGVEAYIPGMSFYEDLGPVVSASAEGLDPKAPIRADTIVVATESGNRRETTIVLKKNGVYYVYFHTDELLMSWWQTNIVSFTQWVLSLQPTDTVYFYQTGRDWHIPCMIQILTVLDTQCKAKRVFILDHIVETPLIMLVCTDVHIEPTGAILFKLPIDIDNADKTQRVMMPYINRLYMRAVNSNILTDDEVAGVMNNKIVFKTSRQLRDKFGDNLPMKA